VIVMQTAGRFGLLSLVAAGTSLFAGLVAMAFFSHAAAPARFEPSLPEDHRATESAADFADLRIALRIADYRGYLEDRRPNSQGDPYQIASQI
jgi:hypothetical protein